MTRTVFLTLALLLSAQQARAEWILTGSAGTTAGGLLDHQLFTYSVGGGYWPTEWLGVELRGSDVPNALEVEGQPELVLRSRIWVVSLNARVAPYGHRGTFRPFASAGIGAVHTNLDGFTGTSSRRRNLGGEFSGGVMGDITSATSWLAEARYTRPTDLISSPLGRVPGFSFWSFSGGVMVWLGR